MQFLYHVCLFYCYVGTGNSQLSQRDDRLSNKVNELVEHSLKRALMQEHFDSLSYLHQRLDGENLVDSLASTFERKFRDRIAVVKRLQEAVTSAYGGAEYVDKCCNIPQGSLEYNPSFKQKTAENNICEHTSATAAHNPKKLSSAFRDACIENFHALPSLKWQYFGSEEGVTTRFPVVGQPSSSCGSYDNRFRPWYVQANVPTAKHVVIVIDKSGSMKAKHRGVTLMELAKEAAKTVINTLNPYDKFSVIAFGSYPEYFRGSTARDRCFSSSLAQATPQNKKKVSDYVDTLRYGGRTNYGKALSSAFGYIESSNDSNSDQVILFMSDGIPNDNSDDILNILRGRNQALNNSVIIMTFGMGNLDFRVLRLMAEATEATHGSESIRGVFTSVTDPDKLRNQMASYYQYFSPRNPNILEPVWTVPYLDAWGLGQMITASLPVVVRSHLIGVVAVDVTLEELLAESSFFRPNELSYSFFINEAGLVINHPLFPYSKDHASLFVSATTFERDAEFQTVFKSMVRGESGNTSFVSTRILPQGDSRKYGVREVRVLSEYYWKQIPGTKFSVCVVLVPKDTQSILTSQGYVPAGSFLYHRLDLLPPRDPCRHLNSYCSTNQSSVMLAARAFSDPEYYLSTTFTRRNIQEIVKYMEGNGPNKEGIKESIRYEVTATLRAENLWKNIDETTDLQEHVIWRYIAMSKGVFRIYPGTQMPKDFDPALRPWYEHAVANRDSIAITTPYNDAASGAVIVTLSRVLFEGRRNGIHNSTTDEVVAVMGVDLLLTYFHNILLQQYPVCKSSSKCILIDKGGYVIVADEYVDAHNRYFDQHIAELDSELASDLIYQGILRNGSCSNIEAALLQRYYTMSEAFTAYNGQTAGGCYRYQMIAIAKTNSFLIVKDKKTSNCEVYPSSACSSCSRLSRICSSRSIAVSARCECPCEVINSDYQPCTNQFGNVSGTSFPSCTPENSKLSSVTQNNADLTQLPRCYKLAFEFQINKRNGSEPEVQKEDSLGAAGIAGIVIGMVVIVIISFFCFTKLCKRKPSMHHNSRRGLPPTTTAQAVTTVTASAPSATHVLSHSPSSVNATSTPSWVHPIGNQYPTSFSEPPPSYDYHGGYSASGWGESGTGY